MSENVARREIGREKSSIFTSEGIFLGERGAEHIT